MPVFDFSLLVLPYPQVQSAAIMSSKRAKGKSTKKRPQRATSNVFAMFDQSQIQEFKEAFNMIDQNRDGFIDKEDLHDMLASLGMSVKENKLSVELQSMFMVYNSMWNVTFDPKTYPYCYKSNYGIFTWLWDQNICQD